MIKLFNLKKNKTPSVSDLHHEGLSSKYVWVIILSVGAGFVFITILISTFASWKFLSDDQFSSIRGNKSSTKAAPINEDKLKEAAKIINNRINSQTD